MTKQIARWVFSALVFLVAFLIVLGMITVEFAGYPVVVWVTVGVFALAGIACAHYLIWGPQ